MNPVLTTHIALFSRAGTYHNCLYHSLVLGREQHEAVMCALPYMCGLPVFSTVWHPVCHQYIFAEGLNKLAVSTFHSHCKDKGNYFGSNPSSLESLNDRTKN